MENKAKNQQSNNEKKEERPSEKTYHVFISYRRASSNSGIHSSSLARSIFQEFTSKGLKVFFDCEEKGTKTWQHIEKSRFIIILVTNEFITTINKHPYNPIRNNESIANEDGSGLIKELQEIEGRLASGKMNGENVILVNIDKLYTSRIIQEALSKKKYEKLASSDVEVFSLLTDKTFSYLMQYLIDRIKGDEAYNRIKGDEASNNRINGNEASNNRTNGDGASKSNKKNKSIIRLGIIGITLLMFALGVIGVIGVKYYFNNKELKDLKKDFNERLDKEVNGKVDSIGKSYKNLIDSLNTKLYQYRSECIIFAGGGTVQRYIDSVLYFKDKGYSISNYTPNPGSKYIHIPSTIAWHLLWDDVFTEENRQYCPIVLSTGKIDTKNVNIATDLLEKTEKRIAEYKLDSIPLMVQIYDRQNRQNKQNKHNKQKGKNETISLDSLKTLLSNAKGRHEEYEIWTTTEKSGTYLEYKRLLKEINLDIDSIVNRQGEDSSRRLDFHPTESNAFQDITIIVLANSRYYHKDKNRNPSKLTVVSSNNETKFVPLYVYTIAKKNDNGKLELPSNAAFFLNSIDCDTAPKDFNNLKTPKAENMVVEWPKVKTL